MVSGTRQSLCISKMDFKTETLLKKELAEYKKMMNGRLSNEDSKENYEGRENSPVLEVKTEREPIEDSFDEEEEQIVNQQTNVIKLLMEDGKDREDNSDVKPTHSYIALIAMAILSMPSKKMILGDIYQYIAGNYSYYRNKDKSWRNSIRHNLSLNECFIKAGRSENGKGNYWAIHPANLEDFVNGDFRRRRARRRVRRTTLKLPGCTSSYLHGLAPFASHSPFHPYRGAADHATDFRPFYPALSYLTPHCKKNFAVENFMTNYADPPTMCSLAQRIPFTSEQASSMASHYSTYVKAAALPSVDYKTPPAYASHPSSAFSSYTSCSEALKNGSGSWQETLNRLQEQLQKSTAS